MKSIFPGRLKPSRTPSPDAAPAVPALQSWWRAGEDPAVQAARGIQPRLETSNPEMAVDLNVSMAGHRGEAEVKPHIFPNPLEHALALRRKALIGAEESPISA